MSEFSAETLAASAGKLICDACHCEIALEKSIIRDHIASSRHQAGKQKRKEDEQRQQRVIQSWESYQNRHRKNLSGTGLTEAVPNEQSLRRIDVVRAFLTAGIPLAKVDALRPLLEAGAERLTFSTHPFSYIPFVLEMEQDLLLEELKDKPYISLIFDGSTYHGEALVIIVRFVQSDYTICQRLVRVRLLSKSVDGQELAREVRSLHVRSSPSYPHSCNIPLTERLQQFVMVPTSIQPLFDFLRTSCIPT